jgi:hypothetical protein
MFRSEFGDVKGSTPFSIDIVAACGKGKSQSCYSKLLRYILYFLGRENGKPSIKKIIRGNFSFQTYKSVVIICTLISLHMQ